MPTNRVDDIFEALDVHQTGSVTAAQVIAFAEPLHRSVSADDVEKIFSAVDLNHRGSFDRPTFARVLRMMEHKSNVSLDEMLDRYNDVQARVLFDVMDDDGNGTLTRDEVKPLLDILVQILGLKTICDAGILFRSVGAGIYGSVSFPQFRSIMSKLVVHRPLSLVVDAYREMKSKKRPTTLTASRLRSSHNGAQRHPLHDTSSEGGETSMMRSAVGRSCAKCAVMETKLQTEVERVKYLENCVDMLTEMQATQVVSLDEDCAEADAHLQRIDGMVKNAALLDAITVDSSGDAGIFTRMQFQSQLMCHTARYAAALSSGGSQLVVDVAQRCEATHAMLKHLLETATQGLINVLHSCDDTEEKTEEDADDDLRHYTEQWVGLEWPGLRDAARKVFAARQEATVCFVFLSCQGQDSSTHRRLRACGVKFEELTQVLVASLQALLSCIPAMTASGVINKMQLRDVVEVALRDGCEGIRCVCDSVSRSLNELHQGAQCALPRRSKDKSCQVALPIQSSAALTSSVHHVDASRSCSPSNERSCSAGSPAASRPPRFRGKRPWENRGPERVEALVSEHLMSGVAVPPNFGRVSEPMAGAPCGLGSSVAAARYHFGTKRIELTAMDDNTLCVPVGGGFLLFTEYCRLHSEFETLKWQRKAEPSSTGAMLSSKQQLSCAAAQGKRSASPTRSGALASSKPSLW